jgi:hypothetical protein
LNEEVCKVTHTQESVVENIRPVSASEDDDVQCGIEAWKEEGVNNGGGMSETDAEHERQKALEWRGVKEALTVHFDEKLVEGVLAFVVVVRRRRSHQ